jgi:hypothetical protein
MELFDRIDNQQGAVTNAAAIAMRGEVSNDALYAKIKELQSTVYGMEQKEKEMSMKLAVYGKSLYGRHCVRHGILTAYITYS